MGRLDQYAKEIFASDTPIATHGGAFFHPPIEVGLSDVRLDGHLVVTDRALLAGLPAPWCHAQYDEIVLEIKMQGDHLDRRAISRALLRRQAREVQLVEDVNAPWDGELSLWLVTSHLPPTIRARRVVRELAPGCYQIDPGAFQFLWIAANELALCEELIPFLIARTGRALDEFVLWVQDEKRDMLWLTRMVECLPMSAAMYHELMRFALEPSVEPDVVERKKILAKIVLETTPEFRAEVEAAAIASATPRILEEGRKEGRDEGRNEGRVLEARSALRRVLACRKLPLLPEQEARIDACSNLDMLDRWIEQAVEAPNAANALR